MSKTTPNSGSGIKDALSTAVAEFVMTLSLQKTEWKSLQNVTPVLFTLRDPKSGKNTAGVIFVSTEFDLTADHDRFTFMVNGEDIDDLLIIATEQARIMPLEK
jgi:hypothetical protein